MKQLIVLLLSGAMVLSLAACGGNSGANGTASASSTAVASVEEAAVADDAALPSAQANLSGETGSWEAPADRKIIKTMSITLETQTFDETLEEVRGLIDEAGGYVESSYQSNGSWNGNHSRYVSITARIPTQALDSTAQGLETLAHVTDRSEEAQDITDQYYDADAHLAALEAQEQRLLELIAQAETLEDLITLENALTEVRYQIESLTALLRRYDSQVAYSTLNLELHEVSDLTVVRDTPTSFGEKVAAAGEESIRLLVTVGQSLILGIVTLAPLAIVGLMIAAIVVLLVKRLRRRKAPPTPWTPPADQAEDHTDPPSPEA